MAVLKLLVAILIIVGIFYVFVKAVIYTHRSFFSYFQKNYISIPIQIAFVVVNCLISFRLSSLRWNWSETEQVNGLPIPWAAWEYKNGAWTDFISPFSIIVWGLDFVIWMGVFYLLIALIFYIRNRKASHLLEKIF